MDSPLPLPPLHNTTVLQTRTPSLSHDKSTIILRLNSRTLSDPNPKYQYCTPLHDRTLRWRVDRILIKRYNVVLNVKVEVNVKEIKKQEYHISEIKSAHQVEPKLARDMLRHKTYETTFIVSKHNKIWVTYYEYMYLMHRNYTQPGSRHL